MRSTHHPDRNFRFLQMDVLDLVKKPELLNGVNVIFASPPCEEFSRWDQPWTVRRKPPLPDLSLIRASYALAAFHKVQLLVENVRGAGKFIGKAVKHWGPFYLWGDGVPPLLPKFQDRYRKQKQSFSSTDRAARAQIPSDLTMACALYHQARIEFER